MLQFWAPYPSTFDLQLGCPETGLNVYLPNLPFYTSLETRTQTISLLNLPFLLEVFKIGWNERPVHREWQFVLKLRVFSFAGFALTADCTECMLTALSACWLHWVQADCTECVREWGCAIQVWNVPIWYIDRYKTFWKIESVNKAFLFWYWQQPEKYIFFSR